MEVETTIYFNLDGESELIIWVSGMKIMRLLIVLCDHNKPSLAYAVM